jgi:hypothetical protein
MPSPLLSRASNTATLTASATCIQLLVTERERERERENKRNLCKDRGHMQTQTISHSARHLVYIRLLPDGFADCDLCLRNGRRRFLASGLCLHARMSKSSERVREHRNHATTDDVNGFRFYAAAATSGNFSFQSAL